VGVSCMCLCLMRRNVDLSRGVFGGKALCVCRELGSFTKPGAELTSRVKVSGVVYILITYRIGDNVALVASTMCNDEKICCHGDLLARTVGLNANIDDIRAQGSIPQFLYCIK
jgi:hypothetical protein